MMLGTYALNLFLPDGSFRLNALPKAGKAATFDELTNEVVALTTSVASFVLVADTLRMPVDTAAAIGLASGAVAGGISFAQSHIFRRRIEVQLASKHGHTVSLRRDRMKTTIFRVCAFCSTTFLMNIGFGYNPRLSDFLIYQVFLPVIPATLMYYPLTALKNHLFVKLGLSDTTNKQVHTTAIRHIYKK